VLPRLSQAPLRHSSAPLPRRWPLLRGAQGRGRAAAAPHAAALEPGARAPRAASPYPRPAAPGTKPARKPCRPKSERRSQAQNYGVVAGKMNILPHHAHPSYREQSGTCHNADKFSRNTHSVVNNSCNAMQHSAYRTTNACNRSYKSALRTTLATAHQAQPWQQLNSADSSF
jgi:hypothetical protein